MSIQAVGWVLDQSETGGSERLVLISLANHADKDWLAGPSMRTIAAEARVSRGTVRRWLEALAEGGHIEEITEKSDAPSWWRVIPANKRPKLWRIVVPQDVGVSNVDPNILGYRRGTAGVPPGCHSYATQTNNKEPITNTHARSEELSSASNEERVEESEEQSSTREGFPNLKKSSPLLEAVMDVCGLDERPPKGTTERKELDACVRHLRKHHHTAEDVYAFNDAWVGVPKPFQIRMNIRTVLDRARLYEQRPQRQSVSPKNPPAPERTADEHRVFDAWVASTGKQAVFTDERRDVIRARLRETYSVEDLVDAVRGWKKSPFHRGENDRGMIYNDIELLLRDAARVERFRDLERGVESGHSALPHSRRDPIEYEPGW